MPVTLAPAVGTREFEERSVGCDAPDFTGAAGFAEPNRSIGA